MFFLRVSTVCLIFIVDAIVALAEGHNMYTLRATGTRGMVVNVVSLLVASWLFMRSPRGRWLRLRFGRAN